ncbi:MAG: hypothetical protein ACXVUL_15685 [Solirubrobacteraceae bacterium]
MSDAAPPLRTLAFGDLDGATWGVAWFPDPTLPGFIALGSADDAVTVEASLEPDDENGGWLLHGYGVELNVSAAGEDAQDLRGEFDAVCRVHGGMTVEAVEHDVDCLGRLAVHAGVGDLGKFDSVRDVCAWFDPTHGLSLVAMRPRKSRGQEADVVSAVALEPEGPLAIEDPRLSTTYAGDGRPLRVGLELWISADDDEEEQQYPRRASGETLGVAATGRLGSFDVLAQFVRWDSRYGDGAGVYLLAQQS